MKLSYIQIINLAVFFILPLLFCCDLHQENNNENKNTNNHICVDSLLNVFQQGKSFGFYSNYHVKHCDTINHVAEEDVIINDLNIRLLKNYTDDSLSLFEICINDNKYNLFDFKCYDFYDSVNFLKHRIVDDFTLSTDELYDYSGKYFLFQYLNKDLYLIRTTPINCNGVGCWNSYLLIIIKDKLSSKVNLSIVKYYNYYDLFDWSNNIFLLNKKNNCVESMFYVSDTTWNNNYLSGYIVPYSIMLNGNVNLDFSKKLNISQPAID